MNGQNQPPSSESAGVSAWERSTLQKLIFSALDEQRRARRWGIFFKILLFVYLFSLLLIYLPKDITETAVGGRHTAVIKIDGVIAEDREASADNIIGGLRAAFADKNTKGVILRINSPGGSPVQAGYINDEIARLRAKHPDVPLYAVITDICASGGYYVAAAADKIYADKASLVGSIGVLMDGFGFVGTMDKLGVERRLFTAGESKGFLDPFSPAKPEDVAHVKTLLKNIHEQFIEVVKKGRGDRLKEGANLYSGLIWSGEQSVELGLVDELGSSSYVAREIVGAEKIVDYTPRPDYFGQFAERIGMALSKTFFSTASGSPQLR
ncbi:MAG: S49 family peptidase [Gammaproteobacteria bacterium]|nr:S49 family peptidase [Gammaproteobacteria bacterium]